LGIIQRQALRTTLINLSGAALGGITRTIMPLFMTPAYYGLLGLLDFISGVFVSIFSMGYHQILAKIFPKYRNEENGHHGLLAFGLLLSLIGIFISCLIFYFFQGEFLKKDSDVVLFDRFALLIFPMVFFRIVFFNIDGYIRMLFNTVVGVFLDTVVSKLVVALAIVLIATSVITIDGFVYFYAFSFCLPGILIVFIAITKTSKLTAPHKSLLEKSQMQDIYGYIVFGLLLGASSSIVIYIDGLMIAKMLSLEMTGFYTFFFIAARFMLIPSNSINRIAQVILAESWQNDDRANVLDVYRKSCLNQILLGAFLLGVGWTCLDSVLAMSEKYQAYAVYKDVFWILGLGLLIEMGTGVNASIIATSSKYRYNTYFHIGLAALVIGLNYFFIQAYQLIGAAAASLIAMTVINILRWYFLKKWYGLQPFNFHFLKALTVSAAFLTLCFFFEFEANPWIEIAVNGIGLSVLFWGGVVLLKLSPDVNQWLLKMRKKVM